MENPAVPSKQQTAEVPNDAVGDSATVSKTPTNSSQTPPKPAPTAVTATAPTPQPAKQEPAKLSVAEMMSHPDVAAQVQAAVTAAAKEARERVEQEAKVKAEREKMDAVGRAEAEKKEAQDLAEESNKKAISARLELDMHKSLADREVVLQSKDARGFVHYQAVALVNSTDGMSMDAAVQKVLADNPWLIKTPEQSAPTLTPEQAAAAGTTPRPSTAPTVRTTTTPVVDIPTEGVDTLAMTAAEYQEYKQTRHRLN